jgi:hypothetical protein
MMCRQTGDQSQLFYLFNLEERVPAGHLLRRISPIVERVLADLREELVPSYMAAIGIDGAGDKHAAARSRCSWRLGFDPRRAG